MKTLVRKNFEKWVKKYHPAYSLKRAKETVIFSNPPYLSKETQDMWMGFCGASVAAEKNELAITIEDGYDGFSIVTNKIKGSKKQKLFDKRFRFGQEDDHAKLKDVFEYLGFKNVVVVEDY